VRQTMAQMIMATPWSPNAPATGLSWSRSFIFEIHQAHMFSRSALCLAARGLAPFRRRSLVRQSWAVPGLQSTSDHVMYQHPERVSDVLLPP
jgi:hypothetical protein